MSPKSDKPRAPTQQFRLLRQFRRAGDVGLTDEEAAEQAGLLRSCYWKRCTDLRQRGFIAFTDARRMGSMGTPRKVSVITPSGLDFLEDRSR